MICGIYPNIKDLNFKVLYSLVSYIYVIYLIISLSDVKIILIF